MVFSFRFLLILAFLFVVSGCKGFLLRDIEDQRADNSLSGENTFNAELMRGYLDLASEEANEDDFDDGEYFLLRSIFARSGDTPQPTHVDERVLSPEQVREASRARSSLINRLNNGGRTVAGARAQVLYDCWIQELEEGNQPGDISFCRNGLQRVLGSWGTSAAESVEVTRSGSTTVSEESATSSASASVSEEVGESIIDESTISQPTVDSITEENVGAIFAAEEGVITQQKTLSVYFEYDKTNVIITPAGYSTVSRNDIKALAREGLSVGAKFVLLTANADTKGTEKYNYNLSLLRAKFVKDLLIKEGVDSAIISIVALGETNLPVQTADDYKEPLNRRVEIKFSF